MKGVTIDVGVRNVGINGKTIVFLDSPGHKEYIPNMISGAVQADYAILVVDASKFDSGFRFGGQTKEHAYIVRAMGVGSMIVAVNKMDLLDLEPGAVRENSEATIRLLARDWGSLKISCFLSPLVPIKTKISLPKVLQE